MRGNTDTSMQAYIHVAVKADKAIYRMWTGLCLAGSCKHPGNKPLVFGLTVVVVEMTFQLKWIW